MNKMQPSKPNGDSRKDLKWFWVSVLFKAEHLSKPRKRHLWERTVFLVRASNKESAECHAQQLAKDKEVEYEAANGDLVRWTYQNVECLNELHNDEITDGTEVYWEFFERVDRK